MDLVATDRLRDAGHEIAEKRMERDVRVWVVVREPGERSHRHDLNAEYLPELAVGGVDEGLAGFDFAAEILSVGVQDRMVGPKAADETL